MGEGQGVSFSLNYMHYAGRQTMWFMLFAVSDSCCYLSDQRKRAILLLVSSLSIREMAFFIQAVLFRLSYCSVQQNDLVNAIPTDKLQGILTGMPNPRVHSCAITPPPSPRELPLMRR